MLPMIISSIVQVSKIKMKINENQQTEINF